MKFEVCAVMYAEPKIVEADSIEEAMEITDSLESSDFVWMDIDITDIYEVGD